MLLSAFYSASKLDVFHCTSGEYHQIQYNHSCKQGGKAVIVKRKEIEQQLWQKHQEKTVPVAVGSWICTHVEDSILFDVFRGKQKVRKCSLPLVICRVSCYNELAIFYIVMVL